MNKMFYNGLPVEEVDFIKEFERELTELVERMEQIKLRQEINKDFNYQYWTTKFARANKDLAIG